MALTLEELKAVLRYDPKTGKWFNRVWRGGTAYAGMETGRPNSDGYIQICVKCKRYMSSRLAHFYMTGEWPLDEMDHRNRNRQDNRWTNLRPANDSQNQMNRVPQKNNRSGCKGVWKRGPSWYAHISSRRIGKFKTKSSAVQARRIKERELFGAFART